MKQSTWVSLERQLQNNLKPLAGSILNVTTNTVFLCSVPSDIAYFVKGEEGWQAPNHYLWTVFGVSVVICVLDGFVHKIMYSSPRYNNEKIQAQDEKNVQGQTPAEIKVDVPSENNQSAVSQPLLPAEHKHHGCWSRFKIPFLANMCRISESLEMTSLPASFIALLSYIGVIPKITPMVRILNLSSTGIAALAGFWSSKADYAMAVKHLEEHYEGHSHDHNSEDNHDHSCGLRGHSHH